MSEFSNNNTLIAKSVTTVSADGLIRKVESDVNGDNFFDLTTIQTQTLNGDGSRTEVTSTTSGNDTLLSKATSVISSDRKTTTLSIDANGDKYIDQLSYRPPAPVAAKARLPAC